MGLLQNGFREAVGIFKFYGTGVFAGAVPYALVRNTHLTGSGRNLTAGEGITSEQVGIPLGYGLGVAWQLPQKPGMLSARMLDISVDASADGLMGLPSGGAASLEITAANSEILPLDDTAPARTAAANIEFTADALGELVMSGSGSTSIAITVDAAALVGVLYASGFAEISITTDDPVLGANAGGSGEAAISMSAVADILPEDDTSPARSASAMLSITGTLIPYAVGNMVGFALPYTELSPQSLANAVWQAPAADNNQPGSMGSKVNTASSGGVDMDALASAVWGYTP